MVFIVDLICIGVVIVFAGIVITQIMIPAFKNRPIFPMLKKKNSGHEIIDVDVVDED